MLSPRPTSLAPVESVLFVCLGNLCRSPMAAALLAREAQARCVQLRVASAGLRAVVGKPPPPPVIDLMTDLGLSVAEHRAQQLTDELAQAHDLLLVMDRTQERWLKRAWGGAVKGRVVRLGAWRNKDVLDPYGLGDEDYAECLKHLEVCVADWAPHLLNEDRLARVPLPS
jgi:protein-tyrosine phosphatase